MGNWEALFDHQSSKDRERVIQQAMSKQVQTLADEIRNLQEDLNQRNVDIDQFRETIKEKEKVSIPHVHRLRISAKSTLKQKKDWG